MLNIDISILTLINRCFTKVIYEHIAMILELENGNINMIVEMINLLIHLRHIYRLGKLYSEENI